MLGDQKLMAFCATNDAAKAKGFYQDELGLKLVSDEPFALVFDANGTVLRIQKTKNWTPPEFTVLGWEVPDIVHEVSALTERGIQFLRVPTLEQDDLGIWAADERTKVAWFRDPDGNILSLTEFKGT